MNNIFKKIILIFTLTVVLWGGVSLIGVEKAFASFTDDVAGCTDAFCVQQVYSSYNVPLANQLTETQIQNRLDRGMTIDAPPTTQTAQQTANTATGHVDSTPEQVAAAKKDAGGWKGFIAWMGDVLAGIAALPAFLSASTILYVLGVIAAFFVTIASAFFNGMMILTIQKFPDIVASSGIDIIWSVFRDIINIFFIFVLLYISITTIIGKSSGKTKSLIANVIIAAILINFSLFFTKIMIDASNMVTVALYSKTDVAMGDFATAMMNALGIQELWATKNLTLSGQTSTLLTLALQFVLLCGLLWSYLTVGFLLLGRMIAFLLLMATSPIAFLKGSVPWIEAKSSEWWSALTGQLILAPAFMFILIIISQLMKQEKEILYLSKNLFDIKKSTYSGSFDIGPIIFYIIIIAVLIIGVKQVKKLSGAVGNIAEKTFNTLLAVAIAAITGGASSLATRGAAMAASGSAMVTRGAAVAARGAANQLSGGGAASARVSNVGLQAIQSGQALQRAGQRRERVGNIFSGQTFENAAGQPNALGNVLTSARENFFKNTKKETGVDLDAAFKYREKTEKEYEKRYGVIANKIGGKNEREELDILNKISTNIENQAENRHKKDNKSAWDAMEAIKDVATQKAERVRLKLAAKTNIEPLIAQEMGVNLAAHEKRKSELKVIIEDKTTQKNKYAATIPNKKIADMIRSEATYKIKDDVSKTLKKLFKDAGIEIPDKGKNIEPKEEK